MMMFEAACPQPPDAPGANANCAAGAIGVNLHNAEVQEFFEPEQGNAFYNAVRYDPTPAAGAPTAGPTYYALLLFSHFAQGTTGLRPLAVAAAPGAAEPLRAWQLQSGPSERRLFVVNRSPRPQIVSVAAPGTTYEIDRMTPYDPSGAGRRLDAPEVRIDGRSVAADGSWPGFAPSSGQPRARTAADLARRRRSRRRDAAGQLTTYARVSCASYGPRPVRQAAPQRAASTIASSSDHARAEAERQAGGERVAAAVGVDRHARQGGRPPAAARHAGREPRRQRARARLAQRLLADDPRPAVGAARAHDDARLGVEHARLVDLAGVVRAADEHVHAHARRAPARPSRAASRRARARRGRRARPPRRRR